MSTDLLTMLSDSVRDLFGRVGALEAKEVGLLAGGWADLRVAATSTRAAANAPDFAQFKDDGAGSTGVFIPWFDKNAEEQLWYEIQLTHSYKDSTDLVPHVHWVPKSGGGANEFVVWGLEYVWRNIGDVFGNTTIILSDASSAAVATIQGDNPLLASKHYVTELPIISGTGQIISSMLLCRVFRSAAAGDDDYDDDAGLLEIDFHVRVNTLASREEYVK